VFIDTTRRDTVRLRTGEGHSGCVLQSSVERGTATLQKGDKTETLTLQRPNAQEASVPFITPLPPPPPHMPWLRPCCTSFSRFQPQIASTAPGKPASLTQATYWGATPLGGHNERKRISSVTAITSVMRCLDVSQDLSSS
jgi:hypothetical protein